MEPESLVELRHDGGRHHRYSRPDAFNHHRADLLRLRLGVSLQPSSGGLQQNLKGVDPLGQRVVMEQVVPGNPQSKLAPEWQIVGVFHTVKSRGSREDNPEIDAPFWQMAYDISGIGVRTAEDPTGSDTLGSDGGATT